MIQSNDTQGVLYGVGVGPGDPELLTLKAVKAIQTADVVAFLQNTRGESMARGIAQPFIDSASRLYPLVLDCDQNRALATQVYVRAAADIQQFLDEGKQVVLLCEGDPFFYGSFSYVFDHLSASANCVIIPGVTSVNAVAAVAGIPLVRLEQTLRVLTARSDDVEITAALEQTDAVAILKVGRHLQRLKDLLQRSGRITDAVYVQKATHNDQLIISDPDRLDALQGSYFSMLLVSRQQPFATR